MNVFSLSWRYLWSRPLATTLNLLLLTLGLASMAFVLIARDQVDRAFERDLQGIDAVVGAKGSPMQLILAGVFHLDVPPGNIALDDMKKLQSYPQVAQVIPLSLGDNLQGFRIVGTTADYPPHYGATLAQGALWRQAMEAVLGAQVARTTGLAVGNGFVGAHGLGHGGAVHEAASYRVTGVLAPCGCVLDRLVLTATESVWKVHDELHATDDMDDEDRAAIEADREVTMALIRYNSPLAAATFPRYINDSTNMQAAAPAVEITRLLSMVGVGTRVLQGLGGVLLGVAGTVGLHCAVERGARATCRSGHAAHAGRAAAEGGGAAAVRIALAGADGLFARPARRARGLMALMGAMWMDQHSLAVPAWQWVSTEGVGAAAGLCRGGGGGPGAGHQRLPGRCDPAFEYEVNPMKKNRSAALFSAACHVHRRTGPARRQRGQGRHRAPPRHGRRARRTLPGAWKQAKVRKPAWPNSRSLARGLAIGKYCGMKHQH